MFVVTLNLGSLVSVYPIVQIVLYLVLCWNLFSVLSHGVLVLGRLITVLQVVGVTQFLCRWWERVLLPANAHAMGFDDDVDLWVPSLEVVGLSLYANEALTRWRAASLTRLVLSLCVDRLTLWLPVWELCSVGRMALLMISTAFLGGAGALQWAYYATLPLQDGAEVSDTRVGVVWHFMLVSAASASIRCAVTLATMGLQAIAVALQAVHACGPRGLAGSVLDPASQAFALCSQCVTAVLAAFVAWTYAPEGLPPVVQLLLLLRFVAAFRAADSYRAYHEVLRPFPTVRANPADRCLICQEELMEGESVTRLPCAHCFHGPCLRSWLMRSTRCPLCRQHVHTTTTTSPSHTDQEDASPQDAFVEDRRRRREPPLLRVAGRRPFLGNVQPLVPRLPGRPTTSPAPVWPEHPPPPWESEDGATPSPAPVRVGGASLLPGTAAWRAARRRSHLADLEAVERSLAATAQARQRRQADLFSDIPLL